MTSNDQLHQLVNHGTPVDGGGALATQARARHEAIRVLVESAYPHCRVHRIREDVRSEYAHPSDADSDDTHPPTLVARRLSDEFEVEALSYEFPKPGVRVRVVLDALGELRLMDATPVTMLW